MHHPPTNYPLLFKTLNISFKLVGIDGRQIASALGENGHDIVRNLGIAAGHGKRVSTVPMALSETRT
mgnify:CR=1 FL=1